VSERVRRMAVAGTFYPSDPRGLAAEVDRLVPNSSPSVAPKALIAPHAGYSYSGPIAGTAYATIAAARSVITRVVVIGPAHFVPLRGLAVSGADAFETPLGLVEIDTEARRSLLALPQVSMDDVPHAPEHCVEVQLPFLQRCLESFRLVPLVVGDATKTEVADALDRVWGGSETLIVISSDLSHYLDHDSARATDARTAAAVCALDADSIGSEQACGYAPIRGGIDLARRRGLSVDLLDLRTSGDTAGPLDRVVGYGAFIFS
jgi:MEMO1 family protein